MRWMYLERVSSFSLSPPGFPGSLESAMAADESSNNGWCVGQRAAARVNESGGGRSMVEIDESKGVL